MIRKNPYTEEKYKHYKVTEPAPLLEWLLANLNESKSKVKATLQNRGIKVNGKCVTQFDHPLKAGDKISVSKSKKNDLFRSRYVKIVYEDKFLVVIEKNIGILSMAADTSGLMIYAKDIQTEQMLEHDWHNIVYDRRYVAVVSGEMEHDEGTIANWLKDNKSYVTYSSPVDNGGKYAVTHFHVLDRTVAHSLVEYQLETGRKNQIRVHSADMGHPVCGDIKYGNGDDPLHRLCLHAYVLCFHHPVTHQRMEFETPIPAVFRHLFK